MIAVSRAQLDAELGTNIAAQMRCRRAAGRGTSSTTTASFASPLTLSVVYMPFNGNGAVVGTTPRLPSNPITLSLSPGDAWFVYTAMPVATADMAQLVQDLDAYAVPGLLLKKGGLGPAELGMLSGASALDLLILGRSWASLDGVGGLTQVRQLALDGNANITDAEFVHLAGMASLESLVLTAATNVSNGGMGHLAALSQLQELFLNRTGVDDVGIATLLGGAPNLTALHMERLAVTDASVGLVTARPGMTALDFADTAISDAGANDLAVLASLRFLDLKRIAGSPVTNPTLLNLCQALPALTYLAIESPSVDDAGVTEMHRLTQLDMLGLERTGLSDAGLGNFTDLLALRELWARGTQVTAAGANWLEGQIPGLTVFK